MRVLLIVILAISNAALAFRIHSQSYGAEMQTLHGTIQRFLSKYFLPTGESQGKRRTADTHRSSHVVVVLMLE